MDNQNVQIQTIENAKRKDVLPGDHLIWTRTRHDGMITVTQQREGIAYHQDANGDWKNKEGAWITSGESELTIHRTLTLPTKAMTAIIPADGHEYIEAVVEGKKYIAREAVLDHNGQWQAAWREFKVILTSDKKLDISYKLHTSVNPENIINGTCKVEP